MRVTDGLGPGQRRAHVKLFYTAAMPHGLESLMSLTLKHISNFHPAARANPHVPALCGIAKAFAVFEEFYLNFFVCPGFDTDSRH